MARAHSFEITVSNNKTEKLGIDYLIANTTGFFYADKDTRKLILNFLDLPVGFARAFDMIYIPRYVGTVVTDEIIAANIDEIILVELKTTKKYLPENPKGFFFGATENEFNFGKLLGDKFRFCFVSLHEKGSSFVLMTIEELEERIRTRRIQYQINL